jgi:hypothetical protein
MANVWVKALDGRLIRVERVTGITSGKADRRGWAVVAKVTGEHTACLAALGRGTRAKHGAERLCNEWPQALEAAGKGVTITFVKAGYPKGDGQWSSLEMPGS